METIRNNKAAETILEFNKIKEIWKGYAMTDGAKEAIEGAAPMLSESQVLARLRETTEARDMIQRSGSAAAGLLKRDPGMDAAGGDRRLPDGGAAGGNGAGPGGGGPDEAVPGAGKDP